MRFIFVLFILSLTVSLCFSETSRPNILLILSDDHSLPHLGCYGDKNILKYNLTPNIDAFSAEGMRFTKAYTASPQCAPSRTSIFTGRSPIGLSTTRFSQPARRNIPFITDLLRDNGYWVGIDGRHHHLDGRMKDEPHMIEALVEEKMKDLDRRLDHVEISKTKGDYLKQIPHKINSVLDKVPEDQPFFLYYGFNQPHRKFGIDHVGIDPSQLALPSDWPDLPEVRLDYARFLAEVRDLDTGFGLLEEVLEKRGLKENTLVIFMGDNGEALLRGKGTLFQRGLNVPLMVRWPNQVKPGTVSHALISGLDLATTILEAANLNAAKGMTSISFLPELLGQPFQSRNHLFAERGWHHGPITRTDGLDFSRAVITKDYHFIYNALPDRSYTPVDMPRGEAWQAIQAQLKKRALSQLHTKLYFQNPRPIFELYNIKEDPFQVRNLSGEKEFSEVEKNARQRLDQWMIRESDYLPLASHAFQLHFKVKN